MAGESGAEVVIDARGLRCPQPTLKLGKALRDGALDVVLLADDPLARIDVPHFCEEAGATMLEQAEAPGGGWAFRVRRNG